MRARRLLAGTSDWLSGQGRAGGDDSVAGPVEVLERGSIGNPDIGRGHEAAAGHDSHGESVEQIHRKVTVCFDQPGVRRALADNPLAGRENIKGTVRHTASKPLGLVQAGDDKTRRSKNARTNSLIWSRLPDSASSAAC